MIAASFGETSSCAPKTKGVTYVRPWRVPPRKRTDPFFRRFARCAMSRSAWVTDWPHGNCLSGIFWAGAGGRQWAVAAGAVFDRRLSGAFGWAYAAYGFGGVELYDRGWDAAGQLVVGGVSRAALRSGDEGHSLRHEMVEVRHGLGRRRGRHAARKR